jgi:8-oxo-dGTP pyrophosphatase MutT (NUDIX family)
VRPMPRPVPPQVIPRPPSWRPGRPAPWSGVAKAQRMGISVARVLDAFEAAGQREPVPDGLGPDGIFGATVLLNEAIVLDAREVNSAVLAVLFEEGGEARLVLTRRSTNLRTHRGEVSFPGGRTEEGEDGVATALREAFEEVNLDPATVTVVGWIHPVMTLVSASLILPVLATVPTRPELRASPTEVERVFDVSLAELADPAVFHEERWSIPGREIPGSDDNSFPVWFVEVTGEMIWGATARMLYELLSIVLVGPDRG